jgi:hypothetical protein
MKKSCLITVALVFALSFSAYAGRGGARGGGGGGGGRGGGGMGGGGMGGGGMGGGMGGGGRMGGGGMNPNGPGGPNGATNNPTGGTTTTTTRTSVPTPTTTTNAVVAGRYHVTATLTRIGTNLISFRLSTNRLEYSLKLNNATKVLLEADDTERSSASSTVTKTTEGAQTDLEVGQRIKISHNGTVISDITVLKAAAEKEKAKETDSAETPVEN